MAASRPIEAVGQDGGALTVERDITNRDRPPLGGGNQLLFTVSGCPPSPRVAAVTGVAEHVMGNSDEVPQRMAPRVITLNSVGMHAMIEYRGKKL